MTKLQPTISRKTDLCEEKAADPAAIVVFGASGDLAHRKLYPGLYNLYENNLLNESFYLLGVGRTELTDEQFRENVSSAVSKHTETHQRQISEFAEKLYYTPGDYDDQNFYENIKKRCRELDQQCRTEPNRILYLAVPPFKYEDVVKQLGRSGLSCDDKNREDFQPRLVIEKPFGRNLQSAGRLNSVIHECFNESQVYRIDHYLGKETVQNIMMFRFANSIFEPIWNRNYIDHIQITMAETVGVEHRGGYYDSSGALRDMVQNHMLQLVCLTAMEPPAILDAKNVRDEKFKLLESIRPFEVEPWRKTIVRGQYGPGSIEGRDVAGYRDEPDVEPNSATETYVAAKLMIDNWRWKDVPFYVRTGKRLAAKKTEIAITFKKVPHSVFDIAGKNKIPANTLVMRIQPDEAIILSFQAKAPGAKMCVNTIEMQLNYREIFGVNLPQAYHRLLLDCMAGDPMLFMRYDSVELAWQMLEPVLKAWEKDSSHPQRYPAGSESFDAADELIEADGRKWRPNSTT